REKQTWLVERERQLQELSLEKQRLEQFVADRQTQMLKSREAESAALRESVTRKQEEWLTEHQKDLEQSEAMLRQELAEKEQALKSQYQAQLAEQTNKNAKALEAHRKDLALQFEQDKAATLDASLRKEKELAAQLAIEQKALAEKYNQSLAAERASG